jgi:hypothetical protein
LRPGIQEAEFERFMRDKFLKLAIFPGWKLSLLKGDKGERAGQYALLFEIDSVQARDRYSPEGDQTAAEAEFRTFVAQQPATWQPIWDELGTYITTQPGIDTVYTDYVRLV